MKVVIIHGTYGSPEENWFPWLKRELEKRGFEVNIPQFSTPNNQNPKTWLKTLNSQVDKWGEEIILVGHSLGPALILRKLESLTKPVKASFMVAGFLGKIGIEQFDRLNAPFFEKKFNWLKIKRNSKHFFVYGSDNDPYVPIGKERELAELLGVELTVIKGAGHFNAESGCLKFDSLLEDILKITSQP